VEAPHVKPGRYKFGKKEFFMAKKSARPTRRTNTLALKGQVALAVLCEDKALAKLCRQFELPLNPIT
jgi:transposase